MAELDLQLFVIQSVAGKGTGLVAHFNIGNGARIVCEKPLFTTPNLSPMTLMESNIASKLRSLSKVEQRQFLSLHNNFPGKHAFGGIVKTNALPLGPDSVIGGISLRYAALTTAVFQMLSTLGTTRKIAKPSMRPATSNVGKKSPSPTTKAARLTLDILV